MTLSLQSLHASLSAARDTSIGYPLNLAGPDWSPLYPFLALGPVNNLGDPYAGGSFGVNTFAQERSVVEDFARLFHLRAGHWGYVTSCGSEGNLRGLSFGRARLQGAPIYASTAAHYSVDKAAALMGAPLTRVRTDARGAIDLADLRRCLWPGKSAILCLTAGTTMTGAVDDVFGAIEMMNDLRVPYYLHIDAALFGLLTPFLEHAPAYDFRLQIDSISVSGHKMLGVPIPCGVFVCRESDVQHESIEYIGSADTTIGGSRSGWSALAIAYALERYGWTGLSRLARRCIDVAEFAVGRLNGVGLRAWRNEWSNIVVIDRPPVGIVKRWQLAVDADVAHCVCMPHVTEATIDQFVSELSEATKTKEKTLCVTS